MFGLFNKQKRIKDLKENDLQKLFDEAEKMYQAFAKQRNEILTSDFERLKKTEQESPFDKFWIEETKRVIENNEKELTEVKEVRENVIKLFEREKYNTIENRHFIIQDWYDYVHNLFWYVNLHFGDLNTPQGRENRRKWNEAEKAKEIRLEEIARRLKAKLEQTK